MNKYIKYLIEGFFDDIEDDIISSNIIDNNTESVLYGTFANLKNLDDIISFIIKHSQLQFVYKKIWEYCKHQNNQGFNTFTEIFKRGDIKDDIYNKIRITKKNITLKSTIENIPDLQYTANDSWENSSIFTLVIYTQTEKISIPIFVENDYTDISQKSAIRELLKLFINQHGSISIFKPYLNTRHINESFFDDIEDDIFDDNIIDNKVDSTLYLVFADLTDNHDIANYIMEHIHIEQIYNKLYNYVRSIHTQEYKFTDVFKSGEIKDDIYNRIRISRFAITFQSTIYKDVPTVRITQSKTIRTILIIDLYNIRVRLYLNKPYNKELIHLELFDALSVL